MLKTASGLKCQAMKNGSDAVSPEASKTVLE